MPYYDFECKKCKSLYDALTDYDETGKYKHLSCPKCKSKSKKKLMNAPGFQFAQPVGTDAWNSSTMGHDYRFKYNLPNVIKQRAEAEMKSHMGAKPYRDMNDFGMGEGIHDLDIG